MLSHSPTTWAIAIASGKGGVGKTHLTVSLAILFAQRGLRVLVVDADMGLANADLLLDVEPARGLSDVARGRCSIEEALVESPHGISLLSGVADASGELALSNSDKLAILGALASLSGRFDLVLIDTAGGVDDTSLFFCQGADEVIAVTTPEPTSLADTYALTRALTRRVHQRRVGLVVNQCMGERVARAVHERLAPLAQRFLDAPLPLLGHVPMDAAVCAAVMRRMPVVVSAENSPAAHGLHALADRLSAARHRGSPRSSLSFFLKSDEDAGGIVDPYSDQAQSVGGARERHGPERPSPDLRTTERC